MSGSSLAFDERFGSLTETCDCCQSREDNNPVFSLPDDPAAVDEDEVAEQIAHREENVPAEKRRSLVGEALDASGALAQSIRKPSARWRRSLRGGWTYQDGVEVVELYRKVGRAAQEECAHEGDDGAMRWIALLGLGASDEQEDGGDKEDDVDACCEVSMSCEGTSMLDGCVPQQTASQAKPISA